MERLEFCRLCALEKNNLVGIYAHQGLTLSIEAKIKRCLNIEVREKANLPKSVCIECCTKLDSFQEFLESSLNAQNTLCILFPDTPKKEELSSMDSKTVGALDGSSDPPKQDIFRPQESQDPFKDIPGGIDEKPPVLQDHQEPHKSENESNEGGTKDWELTQWLCSECSQEFSDVEELKMHHVNQHNQGPKYLCLYCSKVFGVYNGFMAHIKKHQNGLKHNCSECGRTFSNKKVLDAHRATHSDVRPYVCSECGKSFRQQSALYIHSRCHLPDDIKNKFPCDQCNKRFSTKPNLVTHMRIHTGVRNFTCDQCGKSFIQKGNLDAHLLTHSHDKPFNCEVCHKSFKTGMQLRKHHSVHTGAKPHQCDVCGRTFREKGTLREHHRIHTGAMPFTCEYCGKAFRFKGILTTHRRQHTGERPYSCVECQHHFTNWPNYNKHMKRRHGINTSRSTRPSKQNQANWESCVRAGQVAPPPPPQDVYNVDVHTGSPQLPNCLPYNVYTLAHPTTLDPNDMLNR